MQHLVMIPRLACKTDSISVMDVQLKNNSRRGVPLEYSLQTPLEYSLQKEETIYTWDKRDKERMSEKCIPQRLNGMNEWMYYIWYTLHGELTRHSRASRDDMDMHSTETLVNCHLILVNWPCSQQLTSCAQVEWVTLMPHAHVVHHASCTCGAPCLMHMWCTLLASCTCGAPS